MLDEYKTRRAELATTRKAFQAEQASLTAQVEAIQLARANVEMLTTYCERVREQLATFNMEERRLALEALDIRVIFATDQPTHIEGAIPLGDIPSTAS